MKLNDEQISRVLSEHTIQNLGNKGIFKSLGIKSPCLYQAAFNCADTDELFVLKPSPTWNDLFWFDIKYKPNWTTEQFIKQLTKQEII